jgi:sugar O-acyltransferase (sialic acid O-acetyltransferase NeuD family)
MSGRREPAAAEEKVMPRIIVFGAGGHAKVVLDAILTADPNAEIAVLDDAAGRASTRLLGLPVLGGRAWLEENWAGVGVVPAIGGNAARDSLLAWLSERGRPLVSVIHPRAIISPHAVIGAGSFVAPGAVINADAAIGEAVIINTAASVDHDCKIGASAHIGPGVRLCGGVAVGARTIIGVGAVVIPGVVIGADAVVGAGSVVHRNVEAGVTVAGCPARPL